MDLLFLPSLICITNPLPKSANCKSALAPLGLLARIKSNSFKIFDHSIRLPVKGIKNKPFYLQTQKGSVDHLTSKISHSPIYFAELSTLINIGTDQLLKFGTNN